MPRPNSQNRNASSRRLAGQQIVAALKKRWAAKRAAAAEPGKPAVTKKTAPKKAAPLEVAKSRMRSKKALGGVVRLFPSSVNAGSPAAQVSPRSAWARLR